jgi:hypothetical protein
MMHDTPYVHDTPYRIDQSPERIWLSPQCDSYERTWCQDNPWPRGCEDCHSPAVEYVRADIVRKACANLPSGVAATAVLRAILKERKEKTDGA